MVEARVRLHHRKRRARASHEVVKCKAPFFSSSSFHTNDPQNVECKFLAPTVSSCGCCFEFFHPLFESCFFRRHLIIAMGVFCISAREMNFAFIKVMVSVEITMFEMICLTKCEQLYPSS